MKTKWWGRHNQVILHNGHSKASQEYQPLKQSHNLQLHHQDLEVLLLVKKQINLNLQLNNTANHLHHWHLVKNVTKTEKNNLHLIIQIITIQAKNGTWEKNNKLIQIINKKINQDNKQHHKHLYHHLQQEKRKLLEWEWD